MIRTLFILSSTALFSACAVQSNAPVSDVEQTMNFEAPSEVEAMTLDGSALAEMPEDDATQSNVLDLARTNVSGFLAAQVPGPAGAVLGACIVEGANTEELFVLAGDPAAPETLAMTQDILNRPETIACATEALST